MGSKWRLYDIVITTLANHVSNGLLNHDLQEEPDWPVLADIQAS